MRAEIRVDLVARAGGHATGAWRTQHRCYHREPSPERREEKPREEMRFALKLVQPTKQSEERNTTPATVNTSQLDVCVPSVSAVSV